MMFRHRAIPYLKGLSEGVIVSRTVKTFGIGESAAEALLRDLMNSLHNPTLAPYAKPTGTELRVTAHARTEAEALAALPLWWTRSRPCWGTRSLGWMCPVWRKSAMGC